MATIVEELPRVNGALDDSADGANGHGAHPGGGKLRAQEGRSPEPARTGIWVGLSAITMSFAAFTSAMFVSQGSAPEWKHIALPPILYANTLVLIASSVILQIARKRVAAFARGADSRKTIPLAWLAATLILGLVFVAGQSVAWLQLRAEGLYLATSLSLSFFYVFTVMHALHVLGGLAGVARVIRKLNTPVLSLRKSTMDATSYYWHFMGILWLYLLWLIWMKL
ncbi:MAG TPA: cytochrome c oxidase subunit 3 [Acidobacteriota bacterium]|nr:cytochrome c oxidase subunit 3 [Acidobacteriota bacterium]